MRKYMLAVSVLGLGLYAAASSRAYSQIISISNCQSIDWDAKIDEALRPPRAAHAALSALSVKSACGEAMRPTEIKSLIDHYAAQRIPRHAVRVMERYMKSGQLERSPQNLKQLEMLKRDARELEASALSSHK